MRTSQGLLCFVILCNGWLSATPARGLTDQVPPAPATTEAREAFRDAQGHAEAGRAEEAYEAARRAVELAPTEVVYLRGLAQVSSWYGDYRTANESWDRVLDLLGEDQEASLGRARTAAWAGDTNASARWYREHVRTYPGDAAARLEYARVVAWQGNAAGAMEILETYRRDFGPTDEFQEEQAKVLLDGARPTEALTLLETLVDDEPRNFRRQRLLALALAHGGWPRKAREKLATVRRLGRDDPATEETELLVETPLRSTVTPSQSFFSDSDSVERWQSALSGTLVMTPGSRLSVGLAMEELQADAGSGLDSRDGRNVQAMEGWVALRQRLSPRWEVEGRLGGAEVDEGDDLMTYDLLLQGRPKDSLSLGVEHRRRFYGVSPRALDLGIHRSTTQLSLRWSAGLRTHLEVLGGYDDFSDGNRRWEAVFAPRRQVLRRQRLNLDLGLRGWWFGFDENPGNGYYAPESYERYAATAFGYWKVSPRVGVSFVSSFGWFMDDTMDDFEPGGDLTVEATFGIYGDWMLLIRAGFTENQRQETGAFSARGGQIALTRRF